MKKLLKFLSSRLFWTFLAIALQMVFIFVGIHYVERMELFNFSTSIIAVTISLMVFSRQDAPEYRLSWILLILVFPVFGGLMYLIFGNKKQGMHEQFVRSQYQRASQDPSFEKTSDAGFLQDILTPEDLGNPDDTVLAKYIETSSAGRIYTNTNVTYYPLSDDAYEPLLLELSQARRFIFLEFFIYEDGVFLRRVLDILRRKVSEGIRVCLMYDDMGSINTLPARYYKTLREMGIQAVAFNPVRPRLNPRLNFRDHRKMCIVDGNTVFSGGINFADEYINRRIRFGHWKDNTYMIKGSGVWNYTLLFLQLWNFQCPEEYVISDYMSYAPDRKVQSNGLIQSFGDSPLENKNVSENAYIHMVNSARRYIWISTPYLILDTVMINALILAAHSGVDVRIITPSVPDKKTVYEVTKSNYRQLLEGGVKIYEYVPGFIHSKMFICDDLRAIVGTTNMDFRSFFLHFECGTVFYGGQTVEEVRKDFLHTFEYCRQVPQNYGSTVSPLRRFLRLIMKAAAPML